MKTVIVLLFSVALMAEVKIPYPYPNYDDDLIAKEIINGTYMAAINMKIKNSQTGDERYVHVPDSRVEEKAIQNDRSIIKEPDIDTSMSIEDRDKLLEKSIVPKYVEEPNEMPTLFYKGMCPQKVEYLATVPLGYITIFMTKPDGDRIPFSFDTTKKIGYKWVGDKTSSFAFPQEYDDYAGKVIPISVFPVAQLGDELLLLDGHGYLRTMNENGVVSERLRQWKIINYALTINNLHGKSYGYSYTFGKFYEITKDGERAVSGFSHAVNANFNSINFGYFANGYFSYKHENNNEITLYKITENGAIEKIRDFQANNYPSELANYYDRFDYGRAYSYGKQAYEFSYNLKRGIPNHPSMFRSIKGRGYLKQGAPFFGTLERSENTTAWYSPDMNRIVDTGVLVGSYIGMTRDYVYFNALPDGTGVGKMVVLKIKEWGYVIPRGEYAELFAKEGMLNNLWWKDNDIPNVEDMSYGYVFKRQ